jgi:2-polyprenyl-3-methyl-5-hydroxy-6-metoxy-1,4-benzoquinol methylase
VNEELTTQRNYWNAEADAFESIYTHRKSGLSNALDRVFRQDMYDRFVFTVENCEPVAGRTFLDVGCGNGLYSVELGKKGAAHVTGLDISEVMIERCRRSAEKEGLSESLTFLHTDLLAYEPEGEFDVSFGIGLFDYISDPLPVLRRMRELTRDKTVTAFPRLWTWRAPVRKARLSMRGCPVYFYTKADIDRLMRDAGFSRWEVTRVGKLHCVVSHVKG